MFGKLKLAAAAAVGFVIVLIMAVLKGQSMERTKNERDELKEYKETSKRMHEADITDNPDDARDWLRNRPKR